MKHTLRILLSLLLCALLAGCGSESTEQLRQENEQLREHLAAAQEENAALRAQMEALQNPALSDWALEAEGWNNGLGADIRFTAASEHSDGEHAELLVRLNGMQTASAPCLWDGTRYTAELGLEAADGYSYECIVYSADGTRHRIPLSSPENPVYDSLVYLAASLSGYCNLIVSDWNSDANTLTIASGFVQVQLPRIGGTVHAELQDAQLLLLLDGQVNDFIPLDIPQGEGIRSYEKTLTELTFPLPQLEEESQLDLELLVNLTDGQTLRVYGCGWFRSGDALMMVVG